MPADAAIPWGFFTAALAGLGLGFFVYAKDPGGPVHRSWLRFSLAA